MVDAKISTALDINDVANPSKIKLLKRLCPQRPSRLPTLSGVTIGSKRLDIPVHKEAAVGLGDLDESQIRQVGYYVYGGHAVDQLLQQELRQELGGAARLCGVKVRGSVQGQREGESVPLGEFRAQ